MKAIDRRRKFLRQNACPFLGFVMVGLVWGGIVNILLYRSLNVTTFLSIGVPMSLWAEWAIAAAQAAPLLLICYFALGAGLCAWMWAPRWWLSMASLWIIGTPAAISSGRLVAEYLWQENHGGMPVEAIVPPAIGLIAAFLAVAIVEWTTYYGSSERKEKPRGFETGEVGQRHS